MLLVAVILSGPGLIPLALSIWPRKLIDFLLNMNMYNFSLF